MCINDEWPVQAISPPLMVAGGLEWSLEGHLPQAFARLTFTGCRPRLRWVNAKPCLVTFAVLSIKICVVLFAC